MAIGAAAATIVGTGISLYGQHKQKKAQESAIRENAEAKRLQAFEILGRAETNIQRLREQAEVFKAGQLGRVVRGGAAIRGQTLVQLEQVNSDVLNAIADQRREVNFKSEQLFRGADIDVRLAGDLGSARGFSLIAGGLSGIGRAAGTPGLAKALRSRSTTPIQDANQ